MKLHRSEFTFIVYLTAFALCATVFILLADHQIASLAPRMNETDIFEFVEKANNIISIAWSGLAGFFAFGLFGVYPTIRRSVNEQGRLVVEKASLAKKSETYQQAALTDPLTGLQNRRYFDDALGQYLEEFKAIEHPLGMIVLDLDHFKHVNDTYGHDVGDEVLRSVTKSLLDFTRYHDVVARIGGEEFAILAPNLEERALQRLADRIRIAVSEITFQADNVHFKVTTSMGIALWDGTESASAFVKRADKNLYVAKTSGRNRVVA